MSGIFNPLVGGEALARGEDRPAHQPEAPDAAVDAALVAQPVGLAGFGEQLIEALALARGHPVADSLDLLLSAGLGLPTLERATNRFHQDRGDLEAAGVA